jgi:hypothetical protein
VVAPLPVVGPAPPPPVVDAPLVAAELVPPEPVAALVVAGPVVVVGPVDVVLEPTAVVAAPVPVPAVTLPLSAKFEGSSVSPSAHASTTHAGVANVTRRTSLAQEPRSPWPQERMAGMAVYLHRPEPWTERRHMEP